MEKISASVLAFEKKLVPSDGYMYGTTWENRNKESPLELKEKTVRGTISNRIPSNKLSAKIESPNPQTVDSCALGPHQDTLKLHFTLKVLSGVETPSACNNSDFLNSYKTAALSYIEEKGFKKLAERYATNIANGRFLWRNRVGAEEIEVNVNVLNKNSKSNWKFDATKIGIKDFNSTDKEITELRDLIAKALSGKSDFLLLEINAYAKVGQSQDVYPSEELILNKSSGKGSKSKILYNINGIAGMHSQKIGNALRTIDTWYPEFEEAGIGPIAIETYGAVTNLGKAFRHSNQKQDFFTLFDKFALGGELSDDEKHYVMATLVRGGVFGKSGRE